MMNFNSKLDKCRDQCTQITGDLPTLISLKPPKFVYKSIRTQTEEVVEEKPETVESDIEDPTRLT